MLYKSVCNDMIKKITAELKRTIVSFKKLKEMKGNNETKLDELMGSIKFLQELKNTWEKKRAMCTC